MQCYEQTDIDLQGKYPNVEKRGTEKFKSIDGFENS